MKVKKITGTSSYILVDFDNNKTIKIEGELTTTPAFYAEKSSIKQWQIPCQDVNISTEEKESIIKQILQYNSHDSLKKVNILFED